LHKVREDLFAALCDSVLGIAGGGAGFGGFGEILGLDITFPQCFAVCSPVVFES